MHASDSLESSIGAALFLNTPLAIAQWQVHLYTAAPSDDGLGGTEATAASYAPVRCDPGAERWVKDAAQTNGNTVFRNLAPIAFATEAVLNGCRLFTDLHVTKLMPGGMGDTVHLVAADGRAGLQLLEARPCDLVLLDLMMPGMDGWEVLRRIREHPVLQHIPVIILTAKAMAQDRDYGLNVAGAQAYITKPFFMHELIATIERVLATSSTSEAQKITAESAESF